MALDGGGVGGGGNGVLGGGTSTQGSPAGLRYARGAGAGIEIGVSVGFGVGNGVVSIGLSSFVFGGGVGGRLLLLVVVGLMPPGRPSMTRIRVSLLLVVISSPFLVAL